MDKTRTYAHSYPQLYKGYTHKTINDITTKSAFKKAQKAAIATKNTYTQKERALFVTTTTNQESIHLSTTPITTMTYYIYKEFNEVTVYNTVWICIR